jgi:tetratricopeptide (TPR) repeat protein
LSSRKRDRCVFNGSLNDISPVTTEPAQSENEPVVRELAGLCLEMGLAEEAVTAAERAVSLKPDSHELLGNLACSYLIAGQTPEATRTINAALKLRPEDEVNKRIRFKIEAASSGRRPQPRCLSDMMQDPPQSTWSSLAFWKR